MSGPEIVTSPNDLEQGPPPSRNGDKDRYEMRNFPRSVYHDTVVKPKLRYWPWLQFLDQFLDSNQDGFAIDHDHRMRHFDIKVIHISISGKVELPIRCTTPASLKEAFGDNLERSGSLVIAKDISMTMVEALGMQYKIEPEFFANHLQGSQFYSTGYWKSPTARTLNILPDYLKKAPFYAIDFRRPYYIEGGLDHIVKLRSIKTSTPRGAHVIKNDQPDVFVVERISVYKKRGSKIGIILTDQLLSNDPPAPYISVPVISPNDSPEILATIDRRCQVSSRKELIGWLQRLNSKEATALFSDHETLALLPILKILERNTATFLAYAQHTMSRITTRHCDERFPDSVSFFLKVTRSLYWEVHDKQNLIRSALKVASLKEDNDIAEQVHEFGFLIEDMAAMRTVLEEDVKFLTSESSIQEGKIVGWVSKFAAVFLPISLLATILGITDPGYTRWAVLGGLSVPFVLVSVYFNFFWRPPHVDNLRY